MPPPGAQYHGGNVTNPFEERVVSQFTAQEIATLQCRLNKQLGPEYISQRPGNGGGRVAYLEGNKAIALANEVFGFNGWSSSLGQVQVDYVDEMQNGKVSLGLSIVVRITLKDGTYHEDIGYGSIDNGKGKAAAFEKAKKEAATDGLKRALRTFGNVLGNCLYDKEYLRKVQAMKVKPRKFAEDSLYRHSDYALPPIEPSEMQDEQAMIKKEQLRTPVRPNQVLRTRTDHLSESMSADFDDEFDGNLFDGVELSEQRSDAKSFGSGSTTAAEPVQRAIDQVRQSRESAPPAGRMSPVRNSYPARPPPSRPQQAQGASGPAQPQQNRSNPQQGRPSLNVPSQQVPQIPVQQQSHPRADLARGKPCPPEPNGATRPPAHQRLNNQSAQQPSLRSAPHQPQQTNHQRSTPPFQNGNLAPENPQPPVSRPSMGFVTSRAAELVQNVESTTPLTNIPTFNPHVESPVPKEQRTPGLDHTRSVPIKRQEASAQPCLAAAPAPAPVQNSATRPPIQSVSVTGVGRPNFVNPQQDMTRRIGMPGAQSYGMSPSANRGAYKPPGFVNNGTAAQVGIKRERPVLQDVSNTGAQGNGMEGSDMKRQRVEVQGAENVPSGAVGV